MLIGVNIFSGGVNFVVGGLVLGNVGVLGSGVLMVSGNGLLDVIVVLNLGNVINFSVVLILLGS